MDRKKEILRLLRSAQGYISGQTLCERLQISRTAVWKWIAQLKSEGYRIEAVQNRGYRLLGGPDCLDAERIMERLSDCAFGRVTQVYERLDSTNRRAMELGETPGAHGTLVLAEEQTQGRGRRGRGWNLQRGTGIAMSLVLQNLTDPRKAPMVTLAAALAVRRGILAATGIACGIKWPNDLVCQGRKVCGILTEMRTEMDYVSCVVIGVGINVNNEDFPEEALAHAVSLRQIAGKSLSREDIVVAVMRAFAEYYQRFLEAGDLSGLREEYEECLVNRNQEVLIVSEQKQYRAIGRGIDDTGRLLIEREGRLETVLSGEVSVRGVYGYV